MQQRVGLHAHSPQAQIPNGRGLLRPRPPYSTRHASSGNSGKAPSHSHLITHDLNEAMYVGNRIAVMRNGQIDQIGTAEEILTSPANDYIAKFVSDVDRSRS